MDNLLEKGISRMNGNNKEAIAFVVSLKECAKNKDLQNGMRIHENIVQKGLFGRNPYVGTSIINMYIKCGLISKAQNVFDELPDRNIASWNVMISGYVRNGLPEEALRCFIRMRSDGLLPNAVTFTSALMACGRARSLDKGKEIHDEIWKNGLLRSRFLCDKDKEICDSFSENELSGIRYVFANGKRIHEEINNKELLKFRSRDKFKEIHADTSEDEISLGNALVDMYAKCGAVETAKRVLGTLPLANVVSWSALIMGYTNQGQCVKAIDCFEQMKREGLFPDAIAFTSILKACGRIGAINKGKEIHDEIIRKGLLGENVFLGNAVVDMYAKCGALTKARQAFDELSVRDIASWTTLISGYATHGQGAEAMRMFERMRYEGCSPNEITFISVLKACGSIGAVEKGRKIHEDIVNEGFLGKDIGLDNALVDMYAKCGALAKAKQILDELPIRDAVSWSSLIVGYANQGQGEEALKCFEQMQQEGLSPDEVSFICILKACSSVGAINKGELIHADIVIKGLLGKDISLGNALIGMYAKCGALTKAQKLLDELPRRNVVSWNALIAGYALQGQGEEVLDFLQHMKFEGLSPNSITFTCILKACSSAGAIEKGKQMHEEIVGKGLLVNNISLGNALVDMYARCGVLERAQETFDALQIWDVVSWSTLISGYAQHGLGEEALACFRESLGHGISPNPTIFLSVLCACSHSGLVSEGQMYFENMSKIYGIIPHAEHHSCMVDLFGRVGHFDKAIAVIIGTPSTNYLPLWDSLLGACRKWGNVKLGRLAFEHVVKLESNNEAAFICMSNIYMAAGMVDEAANIEAMRENYYDKHP